MTNQRVDSYREVHKGLRRELCSWVGVLGRLDAENAAEVADHRARFAVLEELLASHSKLEEQWIHPLLEKCDALLYADLEAEHDAHEARFTKAVQAFDRLAQGSEDAWGAAQDLYRTFSDFVGHYLIHLTREENEANAALQANHSDQELLALSGQLRASIPPETMGKYLAIMFPGMNLVERAGMLGGIKANAPAEAFKGVCALAQNVLENDEWEAVAARIGV